MTRPRIDQPMTTHPPRPVDAARDGPTPARSQFLRSGFARRLGWLVAGIALLAPMVATAQALIHTGVIEPADEGDGDDGDLFGFHVDAGGPTVAISSYGDIDGALGEGTVTLYRRSGGTFLLDGKVRGDFHTRVAPDGASMVTATVSSSDTPWRVYLHRRRSDGRGWDTVQTLQSPNPVSTPSDGFGAALAWDGEVLVVGAPNHSQPLQGQGRAYVYTTDVDGVLLLRDTLLPSNPQANAGFGGAVDVLGDLIAVGSRSATSAQGTGAVHVFKRHPTLLDWTQTANITPPQQADPDQQFGWSLDLADLPASAAGPATRTLYVGAPFFGTGVDDGRVYRFGPGPSGDWAWLDTFVPPPAVGTNNGYGTHVRALGNRVLVQAARQYVSAKVTILERQANGSFAVARTYASATGGDDWLGAGVALAEDGANPILAIGAPLATVGSRATQGAVHVLRRDTQWPTSVAAAERIDSGQSAAGSQYGASLSMDGDAAAVGAPFHHVGANREQGAVYLLRRGADGQWRDDGRVLAPDGSADDFFGIRVALDGDTLAVAAPGDDIGSNSNLGSVYVFVRSGGVWTLQQKLSTCFGINDDVLLGDRGLSLRGDRLIFASPPPQGACLWRRSGSQWTLEQQFGGGDNSALAILSADGERLVVGQSANLGLRIWRHDAGAWTFEEEIVLDGPGTVCCDAVAFDGNRLAVNATRGAPTYSPAVRVFVRNGTTWLPEASLVPSQAAGGPQSGFGGTIALHGDTVLVGAPGGSVTPAFFRFVRGPGGWTEEGRYPMPESVPFNGFGHALALNADSVLVGAYVRDGTTLFSNPREGGVYAYAVPGDAVFSDGFED